jgi:hypothetical protein
MHSKSLNRSMHIIFTHEHLSTTFSVAHIGPKIAPNCSSSTRSWTWSTTPGQAGLKKRQGNKLFLPSPNQGKRLVQSCVGQVIGAQGRRNSLVGATDGSSEESWCSGRRRPEADHIGAELLAASTTGSLTTATNPGGGGDEIGRHRTQGDRPQ